MSLVRVIKEHNILAEASRDYYKQVDALIDKHGNETAFRYKSPMHNKLISDIKKLMKSEKEFPQSQKTATVIMKNMNAGFEMMGYEENIVMTNRQHKSLEKDWQGDTMFREELAEILMQDPIMSYAIFGE
tara:strand:+ start:1941 stop:2330 length:390 start_codon:yes stop_codon:yes gene_type:complete